MRTKKKTIPRFTLAEREAVVEQAIELIKEPASWTTRKWKCDLILTDKDGNPIPDEKGAPQVARDLYNRPLSQYCIEGAINQATYNVVGEERAKKLGAYSESNGFEGRQEIWPTDLLGIDELAREQYEDIAYGEDHAALTLNDYYEFDHEKGHSVILGLLRDTLASIKSKRKR